MEAVRFFGTVFTTGLILFFTWKVLSWAGPVTSIFVDHARASVKGDWRPFLRCRFTGCEIKVSEHSVFFSAMGMKMASPLSICTRCGLGVAMNVFGPVQYTPAEIREKLAKKEGIDSGKVVEFPRA